MGNRLSNEPQEVRQIIEKCDVCYVGMIDTEGNPYVLPFNFGYDDGVLYLHSAGEGKKIDALRRNPRVCVAFSTDHKLFHRHEPVACSYGMRYRSVLLHGSIEFIDKYEEKERVLNVIMRKYTGRDFSYNAPAVNNVCVYRVNISLMEAKENGY
jgi:uncharacterized protein